MRFAVLSALVLLALAGCSASNGTADGGLTGDATVEGDGGRDAQVGGDVAPDAGVDLQDGGGIPDGCCKPDCSVRKCGDDDGCGGICTGNCDYGVCDLSWQIQCATDETQCCYMGEACGEDARECGRGKCNGPCPIGQTCRYGWGGGQGCVDCSPSGLPQDSPCDSMECACGLDCMSVNRFNGPTLCLKNCDADHASCGAGEACIGGPGGDPRPGSVYDCYKVIDKESGSFAGCPAADGFGIGNIPQVEKRGTADFSVTFEAETLRFTECAGVFYRTGEDGKQNGPAILLVDRSRELSAGVVYFYAIGFVRRFYRPGEFGLSGKDVFVNTAIVKTTLGPDGIPVASEVIGTGDAGSIVIDQAYIGCDQPTFGRLVNVRHRRYPFACQSSDGLDCLERLAYW